MPERCPFRDGGTFHRQGFHKAARVGEKSIWGEEGGRAREDAHSDEEPRAPSLYKREKCPEPQEGHSEGVAAMKIDPGDREKGNRNQIAKNMTLAMSDQSEQLIR